MLQDHETWLKESDMLQSSMGSSLPASGVRSTPFHGLFLKTSYPKKKFIPWHYAIKSTRAVNHIFIQCACTPREWSHLLDSHVNISKISQSKNKGHKISRISTFGRLILGMLMDMEGSPPTYLIRVTRNRCRICKLLQNLDALSLAPPFVTF